LDTNSNFQFQLVIKTYPVFQKEKNMTNPLIASIENSSVTENGCETHKSSLNKSVDLFFQIAASRNRDDADIINLFEDAFCENAEYALRILFWARDIRGGQGERRVFRVIMTHLANTQPALVAANLSLIPKFGRWDDLLCLLDTQISERVLWTIAKGLRSEDALCGKWMPREKSAKQRYASMIRKHLKLSSKAYRQLLSRLTSVVETQMCNKEWDSIEYGSVPSVAMNIYKKAFGRNAPAAWEAYVAALESGEAKINSATLYPHQIVTGIDAVRWDENAAPNETVIQAQWDALPNYMLNNPKRILPVIDVSGSMTCCGYGGTSVRPIDVSVGLGAYIADRNNGPFKDYFVTFSNTPELQRLEGKNICEKINNLFRANWGMNTNIQAVFELILKHAASSSATQDEMPNSILILSDMEFDTATTTYSYDWRNPNAAPKSVTTFEAIRAMYAEAGYELPNIIFWNLNAKGGNVPVKFNEDGTALVSGFSPSILTALLASEDFTPEKIMQNTILCERYDGISL
jgi:hypothetical protein